MATDLRASVLISCWQLYALKEKQQLIEYITLIEGMKNLEKKLRKVGAKIRRVN